MSTATLDARAHASAGGAHGEPTGLWSWITTVDHKRIAIMYFVASTIFFFIGGIEALIIRMQLWSPESSPDHA
jgi:heme/copper-type cytochrome/quinol oxidase subunit 1